jgi:transposase InsO family protein
LTELRRFLEDRRIEHTRGAPYRPMTQGKAERYHRLMKNLIQLQNYTFPWDLEREVEPASMYFGRAKGTPTRWEEIKRRTLEARRRQRM